MKIGVKLGIAFLLCGLVPVVGVSVASYVNGSNAASELSATAEASLRQRANDYLVAVLDARTDHVEEFFNECASQAEVFALDLMVIDASGRTVSTARHAVNSGNNRLEFNAGELKAGIYLLRITNGREHLTQRFVRTY